jgi:hypothetical protein
MEFFINHTRKAIEFAGMNAHLNKFLERLSELVETKGWSFNDDIQLFIVDVDASDNVCLLIEDKKYEYDPEYYCIFYPEEEEAMIRAYDEEVEQEMLREQNRYGDDGRSWSGWDTPGASCDI